MVLFVRGVSTLAKDLEKAAEEFFLMSFVEKGMDIESQV